MPSTNLVDAMKKVYRQLFLVLVLFFIVCQQVAGAASKEEIEIRVNATVEVFNQRVKEGGQFLQNAKGILVFPNIVKAGFIIGAEFGEGALRINGKTVDYYRTTGASFGLQVGAQTKSIIIVFLEDEALRKFRNSAGWEAGVDGSIALVGTGAGGSIDSTNISDPIIAFAFGNKGLMLNLTLEGSKYTRIKK